MWDTHCPSAQRRPDPSDVRNEDADAANSAAADRAASKFDLFGEPFQADPARSLRWARERRPMFREPRLGYWVLTRHDDVRAVFHEHHNFSASNALEKVTPPSACAQAVLDGYGFAMGRTLLNEDEPVHLARRRLLMSPFLPGEVELLEPLVRQLTHAALDRCMDQGRAELVDALLWSVPLTVALHFLGIPAQDMDRLRAYSVAHTVSTWGRPSAREQVAVAHAVGRFWQLSGDILARMRREPDGPAWMPIRSPVRIIALGLRCNPCVLSWAAC